MLVVFIAFCFGVIHSQLTVNVVSKANALSIPYDSNTEIFNVRNFNWTCSGTPSTYQYKSGQLSLNDLLQCLMYNDAKKCTESISESIPNFPVLTVNLLRGTESVSYVSPSAASPANRFIFNFYVSQACGTTSDSSATITFPGSSGTGTSTGTGTTTGTGTGTTGTGTSTGTTTGTVTGTGTGTNPTGTTTGTGTGVATCSVQANQLGSLTTTSNILIPSPFTVSGCTIGQATLAVTLASPVIGVLRTTFNGSTIQQSSLSFTGDIGNITSLLSTITFIPNQIGSQDISFNWTDSNGNNRVNQVRVVVTTPSTGASTGVSPIPSLPTVVTTGDSPGRQSGRYRTTLLVSRATFSNAIALSYLSSLFQISTVFINIITFSFLDHKFDVQQTDRVQVDYNFVGLSAAQEAAAVAAAQTNCKTLTTTVDCSSVPTSVSTTAVSTTSPTSSSSSGLDGGAIAGIVVGSVVGGLCIIIILGAIIAKFVFFNDNHHANKHIEEYDQQDHAQLGQPQLQPHYPVVNQYQGAQYYPNVQPVQAYPPYAGTTYTPAPTPSLV